MAALGFFNSDDTLTPESIERRRKLAEMLMQQGNSEEPIRHWTQGAARLLKSASGAYMDKKLSEADKSNRDYANQLWAGIIGGAAPSAVQSPGMPPVTSGEPSVSRETAPPAPVPQQPLLPNRPQMPEGPNIFERVGGMIPEAMGQEPAKPSPFGTINQSISTNGNSTPLMMQNGITRNVGRIGMMPANPSLAFAEPGARVPMGAMAGMGGGSQMAAAPNPGQPSERELVIRTIAAETSGKSPQEAQAIAAVILNRAKTRGLSPADVVLERNQFEPWNAGPGGRNDPMNIDPNSSRYQQAAQALAAASGGQDPTGGATHFFAPVAQAALGRHPPAWAQGQGQQIGATAFYAPEGRAPGGAVPVADMPVPGAQEAQGQPLARPGPGQFNIPPPTPTGGVGQAMGSDRQQAIARFLMDPRVPQNMKATVMPVLQSMMQPGQVISRPDGSAYVINPRTMQAQQIMGPTGQDPQTRQLKELEIRAKEREFNESKPFTIKGPNGEDISVIRDRDGTIRPVKIAGQEDQKPMLPKLNEQQSKDVGFVQRGEAALKLLTPEAEKQLQDWKGYGLQNAPLVGGSEAARSFQSEGYQRAHNAARNFLAVILRKDTGAAVTDKEFAEYTPMFIPSPADKPEQVEQKRQAREIAIQAIKDGLGNIGPILERVQAARGAPAGPPPIQSPAAAKPAPQKQAAAPIHGARKAADGYWYVPDPNRQGKYLKVEQ
jgi:spore germination cell wall hydrolase CwlJ-like protein